MLVLKLMTAALLALPLLTLAIKVRFAVIKDEAQLLETLRKWSGDY
jgi:hypothetical protein